VKVIATRDDDGNFTVTITVDYSGPAKVCTVIVNNIGSNQNTNIISITEYLGATTFTCPPGNHVVGTYCGLQYDQQFLTLNDLICPRPPEVTNGFIVHDGKVATYKCNSGYSMQGAPTMNCSKSTGTWITTPPSCIKNKCPRSPTIANGQVTVMAGGSLAAYSCNSGYQMQGQAYRICRNGTDWSEQPPTCTAIRTCPHPGSIENGKVDVSEGPTVGDKALYSCDKGFKVRGKCYRTCQEDYTWSGVAPVCEGCDPPHVQLYGGRHRCEGLLRVNDAGYWASFCSRDFPEATKQVICRQLGCGDLVPGETVHVQPPTKDYHINVYHCTGDEDTLCECDSGRAFCNIENITSSTVNIKCEETAGETSDHVKDPVIELKGGQDRCDGQLLISGVYNNYTQATMCDREPTPEMAEVICRQLKCGPPEHSQPFSHVVKYIPPSKFIDNKEGFVCNGNERGLGCCNCVKPQCSGSSDVLSLTCARPEPELTSKSECRPVEYTPRPLHVIINTKNGDRYTCTPYDTIRLCPNIMDASGRFCRGPTTSERMIFNCIPRSGVGVPFQTAIHLTDHAQCMWK
jgi:hypothetical protein